MLATDLLHTLDEQTRSLVADTIDALMVRFPELEAVVLFGSVARGDERPLTDSIPSDVDLLAIFDSDDPLLLPLRDAIFQTIGSAHRRHLDAPRDVNVKLATHSMNEWDSLFIENVVKDGKIVVCRSSALLDRFNM